MDYVFQQKSAEETIATIPAWWRHLLIAAAVLILCSCTAPLSIDGFDAPPRANAPVADGKSATVAAEDLPAMIIHDVSESEPVWIETKETGPITSNGTVTAAEPLESLPAGGDSIAQGTEVYEVADPFVDDGPYLGNGDVAVDDGAYISDMPADEGSPINEYIGGEYVEGAYGSCPTCLGGPGVFVAGAFVGPGDEYVCDGGDYYSPAGVRADWHIEGLEQEDAIAHYDTLDGRVIVTPSNRVCIYAPRFAAVRRVVNPMAHEQPEFINVTLDELVPAKADELQPVVSSLQRHKVGIHLGQQPPSLYRQRQQAGGLENLTGTMNVYSSLAPYSNLHIIRTGMIDNAEKPWLALSIESAVALTGVQSPQVIINGKAAAAQVGVRQAGVVYQTDGPESPRLRLIKLASCGNAQPGDIVEFTLRYDNIGDQTIGNVTIVDNLATRFEYIPNSARSSVDANFITEPNSGESTILRWEVKPPLKPGEGGILRFRVLVR